MCTCVATAVTGHLLWLFWRFKLNHAQHAQHAKRGSSTSCFHPTSTYLQINNTECRKVQDIKVLNDWGPLMCGFMHYSCCLQEVWKLSMSHFLLRYELSVHIKHFIEKYWLYITSFNKKNSFTVFYSIIYCWYRNLAKGWQNKLKNVSLLSST